MSLHRSHGVTGQAVLTHRLCRPGLAGRAGHFADHLRADVLEAVSSSMSLATVTPSLVDSGEP